MRITYLAAWAFLLLAVAACVTEPELVATREPSPALGSTPATALRTATPQFRRFNVGDTVRLGDIHLTVNGARASLGDGLWKPEVGNHFVYVDATFRNVSDQPQVVSSLVQMEIRDAAGRSYDVDFTALAANDGPSLDGQLAPGDLLRGEVGYQVPNTATGLTWRYSGGVFSVGQVIIALGKVPVPAPTPTPTSSPTAAPMPTMTVPTRPPATPTASVIVQTAAPLVTPTASVIVQTAAPGATPTPAVTVPTRHPVTPTAEVITQTATPTPSPTATLRSQTFNIGDTVRIGDILVTVNGVRSSLGDGFWGPEAGNHLVYVDVTFQNEGDQPKKLFAALQTELRDAEGHSYEIDFATASSGALLGHEVAPGDILREDLPYQTPVDAAGLTWRFSKGPFGLGQIIVALGEAIIAMAIPETGLGDGTWIVGTDLTPGLYAASGGSPCYWARLKGFSGNLDDIIANELGSGRLIVEIKVTDAGFLTRGCGYWQPISFEASDPIGVIADGVWLVGAEMTPGTYSAMAEGFCYWARLRGFSGRTSDDLIANGLGDGRHVVTIAPTDAGFLTRGCGHWQPVSSLTPEPALDWTIRHK